MPTHTKITCIWSKNDEDKDMVPAKMSFSCDTKKAVDTALKLLFKILLLQFNLHVVPEIGTPEFGQYMSTYARGLFDFQDSMNEYGITVDMYVTNTDEGSYGTIPYGFIDECEKLIEGHGKNMIQHEEWVAEICRRKRHENADREKRINKAKRASASASDDKAPTKKQKV